MKKYKEDFLGTYVKYKSRQPVNDICYKTFLPGERLNDIGTLFLFKLVNNFIGCPQLYYIRVPVKSTQLLKFTAVTTNTNFYSNFLG